MLLLAQLSYTSAAIYLPNTCTLTSGVLEHKWRASLKTRLFLLTSNTEATENKVQFLNLAYRVKGFQCHSNNSLQLLELKEKTTTTKPYTLFKSFLCDIL